MGHYWDQAPLAPPHRGPYSSNAHDGLGPYKDAWASSTRQD
jgi:hypothetical protein